MICRRGLRPKHHAGNRRDASSLLPCRGGMKIIRRSISPRSTASSLSAIRWWCEAGAYAEFVASVNLMRLLRTLSARIAASGSGSANNPLKLGEVAVGKVAEIIGVVHLAALLGDVSPSLAAPILEPEDRRRNIRCNLGAERRID